MLTVTLGDSSPSAGLGSPARGGLEMGWRALMLTWSCADVKLRKGCFARTDPLLLQSCSLYILGVVCSAKGKRLVSQGGKNSGGRVRGQEQYCHCLT